MTVIGSCRPLGFGPVMTPAARQATRVVKRVASLGLLVIAMGCVFAMVISLTVPSVVTIATAHESESAELVLDDLAERSSMYDSDGNFVNFLVGVENREPIALDDVPQEVIDAVITVEDSAFYEHDGVNYRAVFRALVTNINAGAVEQGGSTITQQLVKNAIVGTEQNLDRKRTEAFYALRLEDQLTKDEILERYLNTVYFGAGAYGVQAAAETYWGYEDASQLGWAEAALLAGIIRNPTRYDPTLSPVDSRTRRSVVVNLLLADGHITQDQAAAINETPLPAERQRPFSTQPTDYFIEEALEEVLQNENIPLGDDFEQRKRRVYFGGLRIFTTFDRTAQTDAVAARDEFLPENDQGFQLAIAAVETRTGAVRAMVGGPDFAREKFNLTTDGLGRQAGSSMKTFVLAALFEAGYTPADDVRGDSPCKFDNPGGEPDPYEVRGGRGGVQSIARVTWSSNNCAFVRLGQVVGNDQVVKVAERLGITTPLVPVMSLPLGSEEVHPLDMAVAYASIGNDGIHNDPYYVQRIESPDGEVIYEHRPDGTRAISAQSARMITEVLAGNVRGGTGQRAQLDGGHEAAGKTGTAQGHEDAWFVGYTECLATAVWMGHPDLKLSMRGVPGFATVWGGTVPAATWGAFNNSYHERLPETCTFTPPESYGGGRYLKVEGEIDFCNASDRGRSVADTVLVDSDGDGKKDCFRFETTTTEPPEEEEGEGEEGEGGGEDGGGGGEGDGEGGGEGDGGGDGDGGAPATTAAPAEGDG